MNALRVSLFALAGSVACFIGACSEGRSHEVLAAVLRLRGPVVYDPKGGDNFRALVPGGLFGVGSSIQAPGGAELDVALLPGIFLHVKGEALFVINELRLTKDGNETDGGATNRETHLRFIRGKATIAVHLEDDMIGQLTVRAGSVLINANSDGLFALYIGPARTRVICIRGKLYAGTTGPLSTIPEGTFQDWPATQDRPRLVQTESDAQAQSNDATKTERELLAYDPPESFHVR